MEDQNESILLEEEIDENYEPTEEDVLEYAKFLGMDIKEDKDLLYIAKEGLKSPLPYPWKPYQNKQQEIYYYNLETKEISHEHPCDIYYRNYFQKEKNKKKGIISNNQPIKNNSSLINSKLQQIGNPT